MNVNRGNSTTKKTGVCKKLLGGGKIKWHHFQSGRLHRAFYYLHLDEGSICERSNSTSYSDLIMYNQTQVIENNTRNSGCCMCINARQLRICTLAQKLMLPATGRAFPSDVFHGNTGHDWLEKHSWVIRCPAPIVVGDILHLSPSFVLVAPHVLYSDSPANYFRGHCCKVPFMLHIFFSFFFFFSPTQQECRASRNQDWGDGA